MSEGAQYKKDENGGLLGGFPMPFGGTSLTQTSTKPSNPQQGNPQATTQLASGPTTIPPPSPQVPPADINESLRTATLYNDPNYPDFFPAPFTQGESLATDNQKFSVSLVAPLADALNLWILAQLGVHDADFSDNAPGRKAQLAKRIGLLFTEAGASVRDFMRVALQGAQPLSEETATAEILASAQGNAEAPSVIDFQANWRHYATVWLEKRAALGWPVVAEILAGLPVEISTWTPPVLPPGPTHEELAPAWNALDYLDHGTIPQVYGRNKPAITSAVALVQKWLASRDRDTYGAQQRDHWIWVLNKFQFTVPPAPAPPSGLIDKKTYNGFVLSMKLAKLSQTIPQGQAAPNIVGAQLTPALTSYALTGWREEVLQDNRVACYSLIAKMDDTTLENLVGEYGLKPEQEKKDKQIGIAELWASLATETNQSYMVRVAQEAEAKGLDVSKTLQSLRDVTPLGAGASFFQKLTRGFDKLIHHPVKWFRSLQEEGGKLLVTIGKEVLRWGRVPFLGDFFIAPLAIDLVFGRVLKELGKALIDGSVSAFDVKQTTLGLARLFDRAGRALAIAAPFLPPPFNLIAGVVAVISIAAGMGLAALVNASDNEKLIDQYNAEQQAAWEAEVQRLAVEAQGQAAAEQAALVAAQESAQADLLSWLEDKQLLAQGFYERAQDKGTETKSSSSGAMGWILGLATLGVVVVGSVVIANTAGGGTKPRRKRVAAS